MESLSESQTLTTLGQSNPTTNVDPRSNIQVDMLRNAPLKNEEIIELAAFICQAESIDPYIEHIVALRDRYDMSIEVRPIEIEVLSLRDKFSPRALRNFYYALGDVGYHGLVMKVITLYQQDLATAVYLQSLESAFAVQPDDLFVKDTLQVIENSEMEGPGINAAIHLFRSKLDRLSGYASIPKYIRDFGIIVNQLPRLEERQVTEEMPVDVIAEYLSNRLSDMDLTLEVPEDSTTKDELTIIINQMNTAQLDDLINKFTIDPEEVKRIRANRDIFRVYGPVNPYTDTDFSDLKDEDTGEPDVNLIFGGARMFTDLSLETDGENGIPLDEWFTGYCLQCSLRIRSYHHAVREPILMGGWNGCYCSWKCVREAIRSGNSGVDADGDVSDPDLYNIYVIRSALTVQVENDMIEYGIEDRDYDEDEANEAYSSEEGVGLRRDQINQDEVQALLANIPKLNIDQSPVAIVSTRFDDI
jgi:hypothetical protein